MSHIYTNVENGVEGQVIKSKEPLEHLEGDAKWQHTESGSAEETATEIPDDTPADTWTVPQLKAYAERESIDLEDATKKDDILAKVTAHVAGVLDGTGPSEPGAEALKAAKAEGITPAKPGK